MQRKAPSFLVAARTIAVKNGVNVPDIEKDFLRKPGDEMKSNQDEATAIHIPNRREMLFFMGATAAATLTGCSGETFGTYNQKTVSGCLVSPQQTEGPYFVDEKLNRSVPGLVQRTSRARPLQDSH